MLLVFFFFIFGTLILRIFGVSLSMVRIVGGIILLRIGFQLFSGSSSGGSMIAPNGNAQKSDVAFVPLAMPLMCGPGAIATMLGMTSLVKHSEFELLSFLAIAAAILATMLVTYLCLAYARNVIERVGPLGIDAITRIVGFFCRHHGRRTHFPWSGRSPSGLRSDSCALAPQIGLEAAASSCSSETSWKKISLLRSAQDRCKRRSSQ